MPTPISNASFPEGRGQVFHDGRFVLTDGGGPFTVYHIMNPALETHIHLIANTETATVEVTIDTRDNSGTDGVGVVLTDLEDAGILWDERFNGTTKYIAGGTKGITGVRITSTPVGNDVDYSITQTQSNSR